MIAPIEERAAYPVELLVGCETALCLMAAGFNGLNDGAWIADAGLRATCVDLDGEKLDEMRVDYPADWEFVRADVYEYAAASDRRWDIVSVDPYTNEFIRCADHIAAWCRLAKVAVILGVGEDTLVEPPAGWMVTGRVWRTDYSGGVYWATVERA